MSSILRNIVSWITEKSENKVKENMSEENQEYDGFVDVVIIRNILKQNIGALVSDEVIFDFWKQNSEKLGGDWTQVNPVEDADRIAELFVEFISLENKKELEISYKSGGGFTPEQCRTTIAKVMKNLIRPRKLDSRHISLDDELELYDDEEFNRSGGGTIPIYAASFDKSYSQMASGPVAAYAATFGNDPLQDYVTLQIIGYDKSKRIQMIKEMRDLDPGKGIGTAKVIAVMVEEKE